MEQNFIRQCWDSVIERNKLFFYAFLSDTIDAFFCAMYVTFLQKKTSILENTYRAIAKLKHLSIYQSVDCSHSLAGEIYGIKRNETVSTHWIR